MKILITVSYYSPHISGLTNSIKNLAEGLVKKGYMISVLTTQHKKNLPLKEEIHTVSIHRVPYLLKLQKGFIMPFYLFHLVKQIWKIDCVLINLPQPEGIFAAIVGRLLGKRVVSVYACEIALPKSFVASLIERVLFSLHFVTLALSHKVTALSDDYADYAKMLRHFRNKTVGIPPIIKKPMINVIARKNDEAIQSITGLPRSYVARNDERKYQIGFLGRISAEKGLEYLLEAIPLLEKKLGQDAFMLVIAGPKAVGEHDYVKKIETLIEAYKDFVLLRPPLDDNELGNFYASLDVLVLPSINSTEAFGMVQVEAMFCGTPVVCSDLPGVRVPILETGMGEIAKKKDSKDLAEKIIKVLQNKEAYIKQKTKADDLFSADKVVSHYEALLTSSH